MKGGQTTTFRLEFEATCKEVSAQADVNARNTFGQLNELALAVTAQALSGNTTWPNCTLPFFDSRVRESQKITGVERVAFAPIVEAKDKEGWEKYAWWKQKWIAQDMEYLGIEHAPGNISKTILVVEFDEHTGESEEEHAAHADHEGETEEEHAAHEGEDSHADEEGDHHDDHEGEDTHEEDGVHHNETADDHAGEISHEEDGDHHSETAPVNETSIFDVVNGLAGGSNRRLQEEDDHGHGHDEEHKEGEGGFMTGKFFGGWIPEYKSLSNLSRITLQEPSSPFGKSPLSGKAWKRSLDSTFLLTQCLDT